MDEVLAWAERHRVRPYTIGRLGDSQRFISERLQHCQTLRSGLAIDVGAGAGFDTFALAERFERVVAIEPHRGLTREARRIARGAGVSNVEFHRADALALSFAGADLVWCNLMSHYARGRVELLARFADWLAPGGWLVYSEVTEGFVVRGLVAAIEQRDLGGVRAHVRQALAGLDGTAHPRFFIHGTAGPHLRAAGFDVVREATREWRGWVAADRLWACKTEAAREPLAMSGDYLNAPPTFDPRLAEIRDVAPLVLPRPSATLPETAARKAGLLRAKPDVWSRLDRLAARLT